MEIKTSRNPQPRSCIISEDENYFSDSNSWTGDVDVMPLAQPIGVGFIIADLGEMIVSFRFAITKAVPRLL